ncbi:TetR/AcrR family transcriptional regulator [Amycolatopsis samaneae]|uniref:TetR/AcrR family transcriptional regulator n=1 Tax=Amycolatopsis samaneae TaxID=664691 RepID=A0ABW5GR46_9PSEU
MSRLSRAELQERNRAKVLAAAREEFAERGFREAKVDRIAERAGFTRGVVYSNFPGKRALYFAMLAEDAEHVPEKPHAERGRTAPAALGAFARAWVARLPLDETPGTRLDVDVLPEVLADDRTRRPFAQLMKLNALLLGLALERVRPPETPPGAPPARLVRLAETVLTTLHGASQLSAAAPGFVEPFDVVSACEQLAGLELGDWWAPPPVVPPAQRAAEPWAPPSSVDAVTGGPAALAGDGVVAVLGLHRLSAVEAAVRAAPPGAEVTAVLVSGDPAELMPLARLVLAELMGCLRQAFAPEHRPRLRVVPDPSGAVAAAAGVPAVSDATEVAVRVEAGRIVARAEGLGACHAVAIGDRSTEREKTRHLPRF